MMDNKIIHAHVYDPTGPSLFKSDPNDKAQLLTVSCNMCDQCEVYKSQKSCIRRNAFHGACVYGSNGGSYGYTKRARKFRSWVNEKKEWAEQYDSIPSPQKIISRVGDYIWFPYSYVDYVKGVTLPTTDNRLKYGKFIHKDDWTFENIETIVSGEAYALFGGIIRDYKKKEIPLFLRHLMTFDKDMFDKIKEKYPKLEPISNIGREALLVTTNPCDEITFGACKTQKCKWDGKKLIYTGENPRDDFTFAYCMDDAEKVSIEIIPNDKKVIEIHSEDQVNENTKFLS
jgi:hypothetical protein